MDAEFTAIVRQLITEQGAESLLDTAKNKAFLDDYTRGEYQKESRLLLQAVSAGAGKAVAESPENELEICVKRQVRILREEYFLDRKVAEDIAGVLVSVLHRNVKKTQRKSGKKPVVKSVRKIVGDVVDSVAAVLQGIVVVPPKVEQEYAREYVYTKTRDPKAPPKVITRYKKETVYTAATYNNRGNTYCKKGDYDQAIADYTRAIKLKPDEAALYRNRGKVYKAKGDTAKAEADFAVAKKLGYEEQD